MKSTSKGFTLIELLVVIAIIGILATIVLTSLGSARSRANDSKAMDQLSSMRSQAELFYSNHHNYGSPDTSGDCTTGTLFTAADANGLYNLIHGMPAGYEVHCAVTWPIYAWTGTDWDTSGWAVSVQGVNGAWCVDSKNLQVVPLTSVLGGSAICNDTTSG